MAALELPRRYRTILVPSSSFQLLTEKTEAEQAMQRFFAHLEPGGVLVMSFMVLRESDTPSDGEWSDWYKRERERPEDGALIRRWQRTKFDDAAQLEHTEDRYEVLVGDEIVETEEHQRSPAVRWYTQAQSRALYERAGFVDVRATNFTFDPTTPDDRLWVVFAKKPGQ